MIHWELCKVLKFDHTSKLYIHNPTSVLKNDTHKLLRDFDIQTDHLISTRRPDIIIINKWKKEKRKKTCKIVDFAVPADRRVKLKESEKKDKYFDLARELKKKNTKKKKIQKKPPKKTMEHEGDNYTNCNCCSWYTYQRINKGTWGLGNKRTSGDHPIYCSVEIGQNTEKSPGD